MASTGLKVRLTTGGIIRLKVDAIFNAANTSLLGGGGVTGPSGPPGLRCSPSAEKYAACPPGEARLTRGYRLPASHVILWSALSGRGGEQGSNKFWDLLSFVH